MTKHQKEVQRKKMMWASLGSIIGAMFSILVLVAYDKDITDLGVIAGAFFTALSGFTASSFFSSPTDGEDVQK